MYIYIYIEREETKLGEIRKEEKQLPSVVYNNNIYIRAGTILYSPRRQSHGFIIIFTLFHACRQSSLFQ